MNGGDLLSYRDILRHSNLKMGERYFHLANTDRQKMINNLNSKFSECHHMSPECISKRHYEIHASHLKASTQSHIHEIFYRAYPFHFYPGALRNQTQILWRSYFNAGLVN